MLTVHRTISTTKQSRSRRARGQKWAAQRESNDKNDCVPVFKHPLYKGCSFVITIQDVEDAFYACDGMNDCHSKEFFVAQGIDYDMATKYYDAVVALEEMFDAEPARMRTQE